MQKENSKMSLFMWINRKTVNLFQIFFMKKLNIKFYLIYVFI